MSTLNLHHTFQEVMRIDSTGNLGIGVTTSKSIFSINQHGEINLNDSLGEMLKISSEGFYVRGVKIEQDAEEAQRVYEAFHSWLVWASMNRTSY